MAIVVPLDASYLPVRFGLGDLVESEGCAFMLSPLRGLGAMGGGGSQWEADSPCWVVGRWLRLLLWLPHIEGDGRDVSVGL